MTMDLGSLVAKLVVDNSRAVAALAAAEAKFDSYAKAAQRSSGSARTAIDQATSAIDKQLQAINRAVDASDKYERSLKRKSDALKGVAAAAAMVAVAIGKTGQAARDAAPLMDSLRYLKMGGRTLEGLQDTSFGGLASSKTLVQKANLASQMGISNQAFETFGKIAQATAQKTGQDFEYMFDSIVVGGARASRLLLDNLGIIVSVEEANRSYAKQLKETTEDETIRAMTIDQIVTAMSAEAKQAAFVAEAVKQAGSVTAEMAAANATAAETFKRVEVALENARLAWGALVTQIVQGSGILGGIFRKLATAIDGMADAMQQAAGLTGNPDDKWLSTYATADKLHELRRNKEAIEAQMAPLGASAAGGNKDSLRELERLNKNWQAADKALKAALDRLPKAIADEFKGAAPKTINPIDPAAVDEAKAKAGAKERKWMDKAHEDALGLGARLTEYRIKHSQKVAKIMDGAEQRRLRALWKQAEFIEQEDKKKVEAHEAQMRRLEEEKNKIISLQNKALSGGLPQAVRTLFSRLTGDPDSLQSAALSSIAGGGSVLQAVGSMAGSAAGGIPGMMVGGGIGAVAEAIGSAVYEAILKTGQGRQAQSRLDKAVEVFAGAFAPLAPIIDQFAAAMYLLGTQGGILAPILEALVTAGELLLRAFAGLIFIQNAVGLAMLSLAEWIYSIIPGEDPNLKKEKARMGIGMARAGDLFMTGETDPILGLLEENTDATEDNTEAVQSLTEEIRNLPQGYRVANTQYRSQDPNQRRGSTGLQLGAGFQNALSQSISTNTLRRWG